MRNVPLDVVSYLRNYTQLPIVNSTFDTLPVIHGLWQFIEGFVEKKPEVTQLQVELYGYEIARPREVNACHYDSVDSMADKPTYQLIYSNVTLESMLSSWKKETMVKLECSDLELNSVKATITDLEILELNGKDSSYKNPEESYRKLKHLLSVSSPTILVVDVSDGSNQHTINLISNLASQNSFLLPIFYSAYSTNTPSFISVSSHAVSLLPVVFVSSSSHVETE